MKKLMNFVFAVAMVFSVVFIGDAIGSNEPFSAKAQKVTVRKKRKPGIARRTYRGGKWVVKKVWNGSKYVTKRVWVATKWTGKKTYKTGRKVVSRTKKIVY